MNPLVQPFLHVPSGTWSYLVADPERAVAAIIDPVLDFDVRAGRTGIDSAQLLLDIARESGWTIRWLLETHAHADHLSAGDWLRRQRPRAELAIGAGIVDVQRHFAPVFDCEPTFPTDGSQFDRLWQDNERFELGDIECLAIATPGHTPDSISYLIGDALFVGDSLFMPDGGTARCDFPGGNAATLYRSIQRLFALPPATRVFVCHDYGPGDREPLCETTIGEQQASNIHVGGGIDEAGFVALREARDAGLPLPELMLPAVQVNIRAGALPPPRDNGIRYLQIPLDRL